MMDGYVTVQEGLQEVRYWYVLTKDWTLKKYKAHEVIFLHSSPHFNVPPSFSQGYQSHCNYTSSWICCNSSKFAVLLRQL